MHASCLHLLIVLENIVKCIFIYVKTEHTQAKYPRCMLAEKLQSSPDVTWCKTLQLQSVLLRENHPTFF